MSNLFTSLRTYILLAGLVVCVLAVPQLAFAGVIYEEWFPSDDTVDDWTTTGCAVSSWLHRNQPIILASNDMEIECDTSVIRAPQIELPPQTLVRVRAATSLFRVAYFSEECQTDFQSGIGFEIISDNYLFREIEFEKVTGEDGDVITPTWHMYCPYEFQYSAMMIHHLVVENLDVDDDDSADDDDDLVDDDATEDDDLVSDDDDDAIDDDDGSGVGGADDDDGSGTSDAGDDDDSGCCG